MTINGAHSSHEEELKGSITPGMYADFVMLSDDPHHVNPGVIKDIKVLRTFVGGSSTYEAS